MASMRASNVLDENAGVMGRGGPTTRRALGDIGNLVGALTARCQVGKEDAAKAGGLTDRPGASWGATRPRSNLLKPRENAAAAAQQTRRTAFGSQTGRSMSSLLSSRSEAASRDASSRGNVPDIDEADKGNVLAVTEYINDIYTYYRRVEPNYRVSPDYMSRQTDINDKMRAILIDWLVEVHLKFKLMPETLLLTVNLIDRFLEKKAVTRKNLQLVGVTAMLIASKYEEIWAPEVRDFVYISDKAYTREQILQMEKLILNTLKFSLTLPTPYTFLVRYHKAVKATKQVEHLSNFFLELALPEYSMIKYPAPLLSAGAVYAAVRTTEPRSSTSPWTSTFSAHCPGYTEEQVLEVARHLCTLHGKQATASLVAVNKKYSNEKFQSVAKLPACSALAN
ncbi:G2/mitotic-specific cyclin-B [Pseudoscourfieldia marina]